MTAEEDIVMEATAEPDAATKTPATAAISKALASSWAFETAMLPLSMVLVQVFTMVTLLICKLAVNAGMRPVIFLVYRNLIAAAAITQLALVFEREMWKKLTLAIWGWIFVNAALGIVLAMGLYYHGPRATSAAYSANFLNLVPIVTFIIAIMLRAEKAVLTKWPGKTKLLGTSMCVCGAMVVSLLKGRRLHLWPTHLLRYPNAPAVASRTGLHHCMVAGTLFLCGSCLSYALWFIVQVLVRLWNHT